MSIKTPFEPTKSFCYRVARYELLDLIAQEPEAKTHQPFRMIEVTRRVIQNNFTQEQLAIEIPAAQADRIDNVFGSLKFFVQLHAKRLADSPFVWLGNGGMYRLKDPSDLEREIEEAESEALEIDEDEEESEFDGWIYAFSFPLLTKQQGDFPIKIGKTTQDVDARVAHQCRTSATFENPTILGRWRVNRVTAFEQALHAMLKVKGKWRENVPGTEWFDTTPPEIERLVKVISES